MTNTYLKDNENYCPMCDTIPDDITKHDCIIRAGVEEMSVKELVLKQRFHDKQIKIEGLGKGIEIIYGNNESWIVLDSNQAHLLKLWLEEHLK